MMTGCILVTSHGLMMLWAGVGGEHLSCSTLPVLCPLSASKITRKYRQYTHTRPSSHSANSVPPAPVRILLVFSFSRLLPLRPPLFLSLLSSSLFLLSLSPPSSFPSSFLTLSVGSSGVCLRISFLRFVSFSSFFFSRLAIPSSPTYAIRRPIVYPGSSVSLVCPPSILSRPICPGCCRSQMSLPSSSAHRHHLPSILTCARSLPPIGRSARRYGLNGFDDGYCAMDWLRDRCDRSANADAAITAVPFPVWLDAHPAASSQRPLHLLLPSLPITIDTHPPAWPDTLC